MTISDDTLATFIKVAETASVSAAANELGLAKSIVSKRIANLEQSLQTTLFARSTRKVALTPAGQVYLDFARGALATFRQAEERLRDMRQELTGEIRLTAPVSWGLRVLSRVVADFLVAYPGIEIDLWLDDRRLDLPYEGFDIALRMSPSHPPEMIAVPLYDLEWLVCASPAYIAREGAPRTPLDLATRPCFSYWRERSDAGWVLKRHDETSKIRIKGALRANNPEVIVEAAVAGLGIALLPRYSCAQELAAGRLVRVLPDWSPITKFGDVIYAIAAVERMRLARNKCFLDFVRARASLRPGPILSADPAA